MLQFIDTTSDSVEFVISQPAIVDSLIGDLFFQPEENDSDEESVPTTKANALKLFKLQDDGTYRILIKNALRFWLAIDHTSSGLSFK